MPSSLKMISNVEVVPVIGSNLFSGHEEARFALLVKDARSILDYRPGSIEEAYLRLRANVYVDQTLQLSESQRRADGTELDSDDARSTHFIVVKNRGDAVAVVGCMRFIAKVGHDEPPLPVEEFFPDVFPEGLSGCGEVSRYIFRAGDFGTVLDIERKAIASCSLVAGEMGADRWYGVVEHQVERLLKVGGIVSTRLAEPRMLERYNGWCSAIRIEQETISRLAPSYLADARAAGGNPLFW